MIVVEHLETVDEETELLHGVGGDHHDLAGVVPEAPGQGQLGERGSQSVRDLEQSVGQLVPQSAKLCTKLRKGLIKKFSIGLDPLHPLGQKFHFSMLLFCEKLRKLLFILNC